MSPRPPRLPVAAARRIALAAQGFAGPRPGGAVDRRHLRRVLERMAVLQLDSVNVVCRSHYLPVFARLGPYARDRLDQFLWRSGEAFEYLAHEASVTPVAHHPSLRFRMQHGRWKLGLHLEQEQPEYLRFVLEQVAERGPLTVADLDGAGARTGPWWGYSRGKVALERLYVTGRLAIRERTPGFVSRYDLPARVIPADVLAAPTPTREESIELLVGRALRALGVGTAADIADYFRLPIRDTRAALAHLVAAKAVEEVAVDGWREAAYLHPGARRPRRAGARALLSPFDPLVWYRPRAERLFGFRYRIEIYTPAPQRVHGYYVLPFLLDDALVARVDLKADRRAGVLRVLGAFAEDAVDRARVARELHACLSELAAWLGLAGVMVAHRGDLADALRRAVRD